MVPEALLTPEGEPIPPNTLREMNNELARLAFIRAQMTATERARLERIKESPNAGTNPMVQSSANIVGIGASKPPICSCMRCSHATFATVKRSPASPGPRAPLTRAGARRREKGLSKAGNARVRRGMIELAWRFLQHQKESALAVWFRSRVEAPGVRKKTMIVALARKLLIALWRLVQTGEVPRGVVLRQTA